MKSKILIAFLLIGCGADQTTETPVVVPPSGGDNGGGGGSGDGRTTFARVQEIHKQYCVQCHANSRFIKDEDSLKASSSKTRVQNGNMPPPNSTPMPPAVKEEYLNFFSA